MINYKYFEWCPLGTYYNDTCENSQNTCTTYWSCLCMCPAVWCDVITVIPRCLFSSLIYVCEKCKNPSIIINEPV